MCHHQANALYGCTISSPQFSHQCWTLTTRYLMAAVHKTGDTKYQSSPEMKKLSRRGTMHNQCEGHEGRSRVARWTQRSHGTHEVYALTFQEFWGRDCCWPTSYKGLHLEEEGCDDRTHRNDTTSPQQLASLSRRISVCESL